MNLDESDNPRKAAALALAERFHVLPVKAGTKRPDPLLAPEGFKNAATDAETVGGWFDAKPRANVGIACGREFGLLVLDIDVKGDALGMATLAELSIDVPTLTADTPSGGLHLYFKHPGCAVKAKLPGIDLKGADGGGYVLAPPSTLPNGAYRWRDPEIPVAAMPPALIEQLRPRTNGATPARAVGPVASIKTPQGQRHTRLVELGAVYRGKGLAADEIETLLWEHATRYFDPPFSRDRDDDAREIGAVVRWVDAKPAPETAAALTVMSTAELRAAAAAAPEIMLLDPLLPAAGNLMIFGPSGHGKSHLALSVALALARGQGLLDWQPAAPVPVIYFDGEMALGELNARLRQYLAEAPDPENLHWVAARAQQADMPDLADPAQQAAYLAAIEACAARVAIFDHLSALRTTTHEAPESHAESWLPVAAFFRSLNRRGVAVILTHHANKAGGQRGSSAHVALFDTVLRIASPEGGQADPLAELDAELQFEKHRRFGGAAAQPFRAKVFQDEDGFARWERVGDDPLVDDVVRLRLQGKSVREIARALRRSKNGIQKAVQRGQARGLLPLTGGDE